MSKEYVVQTPMGEDVPDDGSIYLGAAKRLRPKARRQITMGDVIVASVTQAALLGDGALDYDRVKLKHGGVISGVNIVHQETDFNLLPSVANWYTEFEHNLLKIFSVGGLGDYKEEPSHDIHNIVWISGFEESFAGSIESSLADVLVEDVRLAFKPKQTRVITGRVLSKKRADFISGMTNELLLDG